jgi:hypothetical protein
MKLSASTFFIATLLAAVSQAAPFDAKQVSANAKWVVHVDVDAIRDSTIVHKAFQTCPLLKNESGVVFDKVVEEAGIDPRKDLHGITLYGTDTVKGHGVAIVFTKVNHEPLLEKAKNASDHKVTRHGRVEIHSWTHKEGPKTHSYGDHTLAGAFYKADVIILGSSVELVGSAIDVLNGRSPGITDPKSPLGGHVYPGSTVLARAIQLPEAPDCPVIKDIVSFRIAIGETEGKSFFRESVVAKSPELAKQMKTIAEGFKAMGALSFAGDADMMKMVNGLQIKTSESTLLVHWDAATDDVWTAIEKVAKKIEERINGGKAAKAQHVD